MLLIAIYYFTHNQNPLNHSPFAVKELIEMLYIVSGNHFLLICVDLNFYRLQAA